MADDFNKKKQESLGRGITALTAFIFIAAAVTTLIISTASLWIVGGCLFAGIALLWLSVSINAKTAITLGELLPIW